jgi:hypothetical protein
VPADASSPISPALDQLRDHPQVAPGEVPGLLERLAEVPDPRDPRGVRHTLVVALALTACAVLAGARSLLAVGEWIADAPPQVLQAVGARADPLCPKRLLPAESTVRRLLARIDGDALDQAVGRWLADRRPHRADGLHGLAVDGKSLRGAAKAKGRKIHLLAALDHTPAWSWPSSTCRRRRMRSPASSLCFRPSPTWPMWWSPATRCTPTVGRVGLEPTADGL